MQNILTMSKKALTWSVVVAAILWSMSAAFVVAPLTAKAATSLVAGDLIRGTVKSPYGGYPVFYYGVDGKKSLFSTEVTYKTWYSDFSKVKVLPESELQSIPGSDKNVTYRPGVMVVKFESESNLYVVEKGAVIRKLSDAVAKELYGATYVASQIPSAFRANYHAGADVVVAADYNKTAAMAASPDISTDMGGSAVVPVVGAMTVSLASDNPAGAVLPQKASGVTLMKINLSSGSGAAVTGMNFKRVGVGATSDFANLYLYDGDKRLTTGRSIQSTSNEAQFTNLNLNVAAGSTKTLSLVGDIATSPTSGDTHGFSVVSVASTAAVSGTPVTGSTFSIGSQAVSTLTVTKGSTPSNPTIGTKNATISEFKLAAGTNDVEVRRIALIQSGNIPNADLMNLELWMNGAKVAAASAMDGDKMRFVLDAPLTIPQGQTRTFNVKADVSGYGGRTITTYVEYAADIYAVDKTYNFGAYVDTTTASSGFDGVTTSLITVTAQGGKATVAFNGPSASDISVGTQDALLYKFSLSAGDQALDIRNVRIVLDAVNGTGVGRLAEAATAFYTDVSLKNMDTGARIDTKELGATADTGNMLTKALVFNNSFTIPAGKTVNFGITADVKNTDDTNLVGQGVKVTLSAFSSGDVKEVNTNQNVTDIVPNSAIVGYTMTVKASALTVQLASTPVSGTSVKGASGVEVAGFSFAAGTQSDVKVTSIKLTGLATVNGAGATAAQTGSVVLSATLWDGTTQVGTAKSPDSTLGTLTFDNLNWTIPAGASKKLTAKVNVATSITGLDSNAAKVSLGIAAPGDVSAQDKDSNTVTATDGDITWGTGGNGVINNVTGANTSYLTVQNTGTLTLDVAGNTPKSTIITGGATDVPMTTLKFMATNESFKVNKLRISNDAAADDAAISTVKLSYKDANGVTVTKTGSLSGGHVDISDLGLIVPVNVDTIVTIAVDLGTINSSGISGLTPTLRVDFNGTFEAVGVQSGASLDEGSDVHATNLGTTNCSDGSATVSGCYADTAVTATGNTMTVRKTVPTVVLASQQPQAAGTPGFNEVFRFTVSADQKGAVNMTQVAFKLTATDKDAGSDWRKADSLTAAKWKLYNVSDTSNPLTCTWTFKASDGTTDVLDGVQSSYTYALCTLPAATPEQVLAGTTNTYYLKLDTSLASSATATADSVRIDIPDFSETYTPVIFGWDETGTGAATGLNEQYVKMLPLIGTNIHY